MWQVSWFRCYNQWGNASWECASWDCETTSTLASVLVCWDSSWSKGREGGLTSGGCRVSKFILRRNYCFFFTASILCLFILGCSRVFFLSDALQLLIIGAFTSTCTESPVVGRPGNALSLPDPILGWMPFNFSAQHWNLPADGAVSKCICWVWFTQTLENFKYLSTKFNKAVHQL